MQKRIIYFWPPLLQFRKISSQPCQVFGCLHRSETAKKTHRKINVQIIKQHRQGISSFTDRTHMCGNLTARNIGETVHLYGWVQYQRHVGDNTSFVILRDWTGLVQVVQDDDKSIPFESVLEITGTVQARPENAVNKKMATGEIEVIPTDIKILNKSLTSLPLYSNDYQQSNEYKRLKYRYLDLRSPRMQKNLRLRSDLVMKMRQFLCDHGFVDIETPTLFRRTPGGAKEFIVPSNIKNLFYSLPQSPQQFKQLLMVGGLDRYFQIARCYRNEGAKPNRQPEFTQVDIELSFTTKEHIKALIEQLLHYSWPESEGKLTLPFPQMTYQQAMEEYGTDKPDTRFDMKLVNITGIDDLTEIPYLQYHLSKDNAKTYAMCFPKATNSTLGSGKRISKREITRYIKMRSLDTSWHMFEVLTDKIKSTSSEYYLPDSLRTSLSEVLDLQEGTMMYIASGIGNTPNELLGMLRLETAKHLDSFKESGETMLMDPKKYNFLWVIDFPLFLPKEYEDEIEAQGSSIESAHHPFTAPYPGEESLLYTDPLKVRSQHYDLVLNGNEIGGGSIRIHNSELQKYVLNDILKVDSTELEHLLNAFEYGAPPHGGIALGLDRLMAILCKTSIIQDVIAFPKSSTSVDVMANAPSTVSEEELQIYHIRTTESE